uniref:Uncharacterized protein n=1 Tax=Hordeum vulgare subsp. vulgare TaxID=112509 RepID=A0A8I6XIK5_HORVV
MLQRQPPPHPRNLLHSIQLSKNNHFSNAAPAAAPRSSQRLQAPSATTVRPPLARRASFLRPLASAD